MVSGKGILRILVWIGLVILQLIMTQVVTLLLSLPISDIENFQQTHPGLFITLLGFSFSIGVFAAGWLGLKLHWLNTKPKYIARLIGTLIGAYVPLIMALIFYPTIEPGNPFFLISMLTAILGFYIPGWLEAIKA